MSRGESGEAFMDAFSSKRSGTREIYIISTRLFSSILRNSTQSEILFRFIFTFEISRCHFAIGFQHLRRGMDGWGSSFSGCANNLINGCGHAVHHSGAINFNYSKLNGKKTAFWFTFHIVGSGRRTRAEEGGCPIASDRTRPRDN